MSGHHHHAAAVLCSLAVFLTGSAIAQDRSQGGYRVAGVAPVALVELAAGEHDDRSAIALYRALGSESGQSNWTVRHFVGDRLVSETGSAQCPQVFELVTRLERMPLPRVELTAPAHGGDFPRLGPERSYTLTLAAWTQDNEPSRVVIHHGGSGPIAAWDETAKQALAGCWQPRSAQ